MPVSRRIKLRNWFYYLTILGGFPLIIWMAYYSTTEAYEYWRHGVEKPAKVVSLDHVGSVARSGRTYFYVLEIDGRSDVRSFQTKLPIGKTVSILVLVDEPDKLTLGTEESTWFELYSYICGGKVMGILSLALYAFMIIGGPLLFIELIKKRRDWLDQE